jgi:hypothetical protein
MSESPDTVAVLAEELGRALDPLKDAFSSDDALRDFLRDLGWDLGPLLNQLSSLKGSVEQAFARADAGDAEGLELLQSVAAAYRAISEIRNAGGLPGDFRATFPGQLAEFLIVEYLVNQRPVIGQLLRVLGVIRFEDVAAGGGRPAYTRRTLAFSDFGDFIEDPFVFFRNAYAWGQSTFDGDRFLESLAGLAEALSFPAYDLPLSDAAGDALTAGALDPDAAAGDAFRVPLVESSVEAAAFNAGIGLFLLPETAALKPGVALMPYATGEFSESVEITDSLDLTIRGGLDLVGGVGVLVRPDRELETFLGLESGAPSGASGTVALELRLAEPGTPVIVLGVAGGSRLEAAGVSATAGTRFHSDGQFEAFFEVALERGRVVLKPAAGESDGFLAMLLPPNGVQAEFDLGVGLSTVRGVYFDGSAGLEVNIPVHVQLGPLELQSALLAARVIPPAAGQPFGIPVEMAATIKGDLGIMKAVVENVGATANFTFPDGGDGNLGPIDLALAFRPPNGVGLTIDAGVVKGGGYLFFDHAKGEYAGALELTAGFLSLKAIGLINTKLPDGRPGFSLLVIITAEFNPGFQLGYGFTLIGVGGILGLNRVLLLEPLAAGVRTGAVNNILFPRDVVANAPRILSDLRTIFPPEQGTTVIGPMAKIGWGTPTLISISLGVVIEIPGNVVILGRLRVALPTEEAAVVVLQVTFIGALEFERRRIWFFASLYESRVLFLTLDGEMGLLMDYGDQPEFVLSVGGFHPRFTAPALPFPSPARLQISIVNESFARVRAETYFAVTSNSVQMGCRAEAFFGFDAFSVEGYFSFDALLRFSPFYLVVEVSAGFSVKVFGAGVWGVHLRGSIEGPTPWRVRGSAEIEILFFSFDVDVDVTFGERRHDVLPPIAVLPQIKAELEKLESWRATLPASGRLFVSLRELGAADALVLHPVGTLQISQRFAPLNLPLDRIGQQKPSDVNRVTVRAESASLAVRGPVREKFAAAQYRDMDDAAKLSAPSFEPLDAGIELGASGQDWTTGPLAQRNVRYEQIILDTPPERPRKRFYEFPNGLFVHFRAGAAIYRSAPSLANEKRLKPFADKVTVGGDSYTVAFQADNRATSTTATFASFAEAEAHLAAAVQTDPILVDALHVIPEAEANVEA